MKASLRPEQQNVINAVLKQQVTVVSAGAGTGKTHTTIAAVLALLEQQNPEESVSLDQFVLITFSRKAAAELRSRLAQALRTRLQHTPKTDTRQVWFWRKQAELLSSAFIGTIHAFCWQLLQTYGYHEHVAREASITFSAFHLQQAFRQARAEFTQDPEVVRVLFPEGKEPAEHKLQQFIIDLIEHAQNRHLSLQEVLERTRKRNPQEEGYAHAVALAQMAVRVQSLYQDMKNQEQVVDAHDLLFRTCALLGHGAVAQQISERHRYLFVDEFQDTDAIQMELLEALQPHLRRLVVVGDQKQSIYHFRGARHDFLQQTAEKFGVAPPLPLRTTSRTREELLALQNALFASMAKNGWEGLNDPLTTDPGRKARVGGSPLPALQHVDASPKRADREASMAATLQQIQQALQVGYRHEDIALLFRSNLTMQEYLQYLRDQGLPAQASTGDAFYSQPEIIDVYRVLRLVLQRDDDVVLSLALDTSMLQHARDRHLERQMLGDHRPHPSLVEWFNTQPSGTPQHQLASTLEDLRSHLLEDTVSAFLGRLYEAFNVKALYSAAALRHLDRLRTLARTTMEVEQALTVRDFNRLLQLRIETGAREEEINPPSHAENPVASSHLRLMTVHASKGLEFPVVVLPEVQTDLVRKKQLPDFVVGMASDPPHDFGLDVNPAFIHLDDMTLFSQRHEATQQDRLGEEMRLLYVAVTRARESVIFIGSGAEKHRPGVGQNHSWQDEVLGARSTLMNLGAVFD